MKKHLDEINDDYQKKLQYLQQLQAELETSQTQAQYLERAEQSTVQRHDLLNTTKALNNQKSLNVYKIQTTNP